MKCPETEDKHLFKILIVDDNPQNLQVLGNILNSKEYDIEFATGGYQALEWLDHTNFDLIILDIMMPGMSGFEVCETIKLDSAKKKIPIIFLTANNDTKSIVKGLELGAVDYITKPFNHQELLARVGTQVKIKKSQDQIACNLKDIESKNKLITHSIRYAQYIQNTVIRMNASISKIFPEYFIFFQPKDIVSGDFYWIHTFMDGIIFAVMDCTGHGVPGALMSMIGITLMNEIVKHKQITQPDQILNRLREKVIESLGQKGKEAEVQDGMDGTIIKIDFNKKRMQFSGANNTMFIIRDHEHIHLCGDRMPISHYQRMEDFTNKDIGLQKGDMLYLFTDGYSDQFGGAQYKKIKTIRFKELLLKVHEKSASEQKKIITQNFKEWKGEHEQTDDITVIGIKI